VVKVSKMGRVEDLLSGFCVDAERELKPKLQGLTGLFLRGFLPQAWVFETESESVTVLADANGNVSIWQGNGLQRDLTIKWRHDLLCKVLETKTKDCVPSGERPTVISHTNKGGVAFNYLKGRLGL
jgi:hypothetical protein